MLSDDDFRRRLDATNTAEFFGDDRTGTLLSAHRNPDIGAMMVRTFAHVVGTRAPFLGDRNFMLQNRFWRYQALILPFATDGTTVDMVANILSYDDSGD